MTLADFDLDSMHAGRDLRAGMRSGLDPGSADEDHAEPAGRLWDAHVHRAQEAVRLHAEGRGMRLDEPVSDIPLDVQARIAERY